MLKQWEKKPLANGIDVADHFGLVGWVVKRMARDADERDRVKSEAMIGLFYAARYWNPEHGGKFSTYAIACMVGWVNGYRSREKRFRARDCIRNGRPVVRTLRLFSEMGRAFVGGNANLFAVDDREDQLCLSEIRTAISGALKTLTLRERTVLCLRFGLEGSLQYTLKECGRILRITPERVRQIEMKGMRKLTDHQRKDAFRPFAESDEELAMLA